MSEEMLQKVENTLANYKSLIESYEVTIKQLKEIKELDSKIIIALKEKIELLETLNKFHD